MAALRLSNGDHAGARAALAPWLARDLVGTYVALAESPGLRPLLSDPEIGRLRAKRRGTLRVNRSSLSIDAVGYAPERGLVVRQRSLAGWGSQLGRGSRGDR